MARNKEGFFSRGFKRLVESRSRDADRYVANTLLRMDDETLAARGYSREQLRKVAGGGFYY